MKEYVMKISTEKAKNNGNKQQTRYKSKNKE